MKFEKILRAAALLASLGCAAGGAQADTVTLSGFLGGRSAAVDLNTPNNINALAGEFAGQWNNNTFSAMCVDVLHYLSFGPTYSYTAVTAAGYGFTPTQLGLFNRLYTNHYAASHASSTAAGAFQLAVWEITYDGNGPLNLAGGAFTLGSGGSLAARNQAASWLSSLAGEAPGNWSFTVLDSSGPRATQDLLVALPVPEPATYAMMLSGLGLLGFAARKKRKQ